MSVLNGDRCMMAMNGVVFVSIKPCNKLVVTFCFFLAVLARLTAVSILNWVVTLNVNS